MSFPLHPSFRISINQSPVSWVHGYNSVGFLLNLKRTQEIPSGPSLGSPQTPNHGIVMNYSELVTLPFKPNKNFKGSLPTGMLFENDGPLPVTKGPFPQLQRLVEILNSIRWLQNCRNWTTIRNPFHQMLLLKFLPTRFLVPSFNFDRWPSFIFDRRIRFPNKNWVLGCLWLVKMNSGLWVSLLVEDINIF